MASLDADRAEIAAAIHRHKSNGPTTPPPTWLDRDEILARISFASWLNRDIPPLDRLLGDLLTTTTRMMLVAPTGLGKTNLALANRCGDPARCRLPALARRRPAEACPLHRRRDE